MQTSSEPTSKKRKLGQTGPSGSQGSQSKSFTEVLEKIKDEARESGGVSFRLKLKQHGAMFSLDAEGGSKSWPRPPLAPLDPSKDSIST